MEKHKKSNTHCHSLEKFSNTFKTFLYIIEQMSEMLTSNNDLDMTVCIYYCFHVFYHKRCFML